MRYLCLSGLKVNQEKLLQVDAAKCIRLTAELLVFNVPLKVKIDKANNLVEGYEEYLVAHTLDHQTIQVS